MHRFAFGSVLVLLLALTLRAADWYQFRGPQGNSMGRSVIYVADGNTGNVACYAVPWNRQAVTSGAPQAGPLVRVAVGKARVVAVQE